MELTTGTAALTLLGKAVEVVGKLNQSANDAAVNEKAIELHGLIISLQSEILHFQSEYANLLQVKNDLEKKLADADQWSETAKKYELQTVAPGTTVYVLKQEYQESEPIHGICTNCYENGHKSILGYKGEQHVSGSIMNKFACTDPDCKAEWLVPYGIMGNDFPLLG